WLHDQSVFTVNNDLGDIADASGDDRPATGESFAQDNRRRFSVPRSDHDHVRGRENVRRVPPISHHQDVAVETSAVDCPSYPFFPAPAASCFAENNKMRIQTRA